jgi:hypothetical protein
VADVSDGTRTVDRIDVAELEEAARNDGVSSTTVYIGGAGWDTVLALIEGVKALHELHDDEVCGCTSPGNSSKCVGSPLFAALQRFDFAPQEGSE